jgi:hypothetical protein
MSPVGTIMIHNVTCRGVSGDYHNMDEASEMLQTLNRSMANAYAVKSGRPLDEILELMDRETWITANQAMEYGFIDEILEPEQPLFSNSFEGLRLTPEIMQRVKSEKEKEDKEKHLKDEILGDLDLYGV